MGKFVNDKIANDAFENGTLIGKTEPSRETKYSWWEVYIFNGDIIACVLTDCGVCCGELISVDELNLYVDDIKQAHELLKEI